MRPGVTAVAVAAACALAVAAAAGGGSGPVYDASLAATVEVEVVGPNVDGRSPVSGRELRLRTRAPAHWSVVPRSGRAVFRPGVVRPAVTLLRRWASSAAPAAAARRRGLALRVTRPRAGVLAWKRVAGSLGSVAACGRTVRIAGPEIAPGKVPDRVLLRGGSPVTSSATATQHTTVRVPDVGTCRVTATVGWTLTLTRR